MGKKERPEFTRHADEISGAEIVALQKAALEKRLAVEFQFYWFSKLEARDRWKNNKGIVSGIIDGEKRACYTSVTFWEESPPNYSDYKLVGKTKINADIDLVTGIDEAAFNARRFERQTTPPEPKSFRKTDPMDVLDPRPLGGAFETEIADDIFEDD